MHGYNLTLKTPVQKADADMTKEKQQPLFWHSRGVFFWGLVNTSSGFSNFPSCFRRRDMQLELNWIEFRICLYLESAASSPFLGSVTGKFCMLRWRSSGQSFSIPAMPAFAWSLIGRLHQKSSQARVHCDVHFGGCSCSKSCLPLCSKFENGCNYQTDCHWQMCNILNPRL